MTQQTFDPVLLRTFLAVTEGLSFTRAAVELCVTQAAVSHQVKALEQRLGQVAAHEPGHSSHQGTAGAALLRETPQP